MTISFCLTTLPLQDLNRRQCDMCNLPFSHSIHSLFTIRHERDNSLSFLPFECDVGHALLKSTHA